MLAELAFSAGDLAQMRFAVSPLWVVVTSFRRLLNDGAVSPVYRPWAAQVRPRLAAAGLDRGWLCELIPSSKYVPHFLNPAPAGPAPVLATELAELVAAPPETVRRNLDHLRYHQDSLGPRARALYADPAARLPRLAQEIEAYWKLALAPYWARIRTVLEADVFHRARQAAEQGAGQVINELHSAVRWDEDVLSLVRRTRPLTREMAGRGLLLVPSAFLGPGLLTRMTPPDPPQIAYPARGVGSLWASRPPTAKAEAVAAVLGRSRTLLLTELDAPASTTELARRTGLSAAGVSQNLTALRDAGLVSAHRAGRSVLYARTAVAETLLGADTR
ncbi:DUF5937 family protein [Streptomyces sp. NPDC020817]|uniref:ArsR/SmtB family transcription factor n=1 Tax=Streptomyces sp. NPDC020817 TaxID=3365095 RepID=UPI00379E3CD9